MSDPPATPDGMSERADEASLALLMLLERLSPEARAAYLLHEIFGADYREIEAVLGKSKAECRRLVIHAKAQLRDERPR